MGKMCADCKYHICKTVCTESEACNGYCQKHRTRQMCHKEICEDYRLDKFFLYLDNIERIKFEGD